MDSTAFRTHGKGMVDYISNYLDNIGERRVVPDVSPGYLRELLPAQAPENSEPWQDIMEDVEKYIMPGITHWQHPRFHAYFPAGNSFPSIMGDMLGDAIGCIGFSWAACPALTELEIQMTDWLAQMMGLPDHMLHRSGEGGGVLQNSASDAVLVSMLTARYYAIENFKLSSQYNKQAYPNDASILSRLVGYCSSLAHSCVEKAGMVAFTTIKQLPTDERYSLRGKTLREAIEEDVKNGMIPFFVSATLGTTACCSFDDLEELAEVCQKYRIWLHVDAAYAGNAMICPEYRHLMKGIEHANSFNFNPNKWMLTNFDISVMWMKSTEQLTRSMIVDPVYLQHKHSNKAVDFRHWGIPLSRRFRALKLWFVIRSYGVEGLRNCIRNHVKLAKEFESLVKADDRFEVVGDVQTGLVCFRIKQSALKNRISVQGLNSLNQCLIRTINESGRLHMVPAVVKDKYIIRFVVCAERAESADVTHAWSVIRGFGDEIITAQNSLNTWKQRLNSARVHSATSTIVTKTTVATAVESVNAGGGCGVGVCGGNADNNNADTDDAADAAVEDLEVVTLDDEDIQGEQYKLQILARLDDSFLDNASDSTCSSDEEEDESRESIAKPSRIAAATGATFRHPRLGATSMCAATDDSDKDEEEEEEEGEGTADEEQEEEEDEDVFVCESDLGVGVAHNSTLTKLRRQTLLKMISDPAVYNRRVLRSLCFCSDHRKSATATSRRRTNDNLLDPIPVELGSSDDHCQTSADAPRRRRAARESSGAAGVTVSVCEPLFSSDDGGGATGLECTAPLSRSSHSLLSGGKSPPLRRCCPNNPLAVATATSNLSGSMSGSASSSSSESGLCNGSTASLPIRCHGNADNCGSRGRNSATNNKKMRRKNSSRKSKSEVLMAQQLPEHRIAAAH